MGTLAAGLLAFGVVLLVELPDKTLVATLVLATRYRPRPVLLGVGLAFAVQCAVAAVAGGVLTLLPHRTVDIVVAVLFAVGSVVLIRESLTRDDDPELAASREQASFASVVGTSFAVLFAAEWGDASQLATAGLVARHHGVGHAVVTAIGAWLALMAVATVAVFAGKVIMRYVPVRLVHRMAGVLFAAFAVVALVAAARA